MKIFASFSSLQRGTFRGFFSFVLVKFSDWVIWGLGYLVREVVFGPSLPPWLPIRTIYILSYRYKSKSLQVSWTRHFSRYFYHFGLKSAQQQNVQQFPITINTRMKVWLNCRPLPRWVILRLCGEKYYSF